MKKKQIAIFASGGGSNARKIMEYFKNHPRIAVALLVCNKAGAGAFEVAAEHGVPSVLLSRSTFYQSEEILDTLRQHKVDFVVLAGFLWLVPGYLVQAFPRKMLNIHPALLPKYGGKGLYGHHVHEAVKAAGERFSGMTVHFVNERYDEGSIVFQASTPLAPADSPDDIARKVLTLEHRFFSKTIEQVIDRQC